jgi:DNA-binding MarR family transcriptional regulator
MRNDVALIMAESTWALQLRRHDGYSYAIPAPETSYVIGHGRQRLLPAGRADDRMLRRHATRQLLNESGREAQPTPRTSKLCGMSDAPPFSPVIALLTIARTWDAQLSEGLKPLGLNTRQFGLLGHIHASPAVSFSELARRSRITVQSAHTAVTNLVDAGLVQDVTAHAGAASSLRVTDAGRVMLERARQIVKTLDARLTEDQPEVAEALRMAMARQFTVQEVS